MLSTIFIILSILWLIGGVLTFLVGVANSNGEQTIVAIIILAGTFVANMCSPMNHISDLTLIRNQGQVVQVREDAIARINQDLAVLPTAGALMNADSPVKSLIETKSTYITELTTIKASIVDAKISIEQRKMGPGAWAVWIFGEE